MSYIGNSPTSVAFLTDLFTGTGSLSVFTMSTAPASTSSILVSITGVVQEPSTYAIAGTTLTFSQAPPAGTGNISVRYLGIPASGIVSTAYRTVTDFTATIAQTIFTVPSYTVGFIDVYRNGARLGAADYTATSGTNVVLAIGANTGDLVTTESFYVSSVLNAIPAVAGAVSLTTQVSGTLPVANGGTGVTTSTGTGSTVLSASPTFTGTTTATNLAYTGTLTGSTGVLNIGSGQVYKDASGNVGINTSNPVRKLHVGSVTEGGGVSVSGTAPNISITNANTEPNTNTMTSTFALATSAGNYSLNAGEAGWLGIGASRGNFVINPNYSGAGIKDIILQPSSGNVGIGTSSPASKLTVYNATDNSVTLSIQGSTSLIKDYGPSINFQYSSGAGQVLSNIKGAWDATSSGGYGNLIFSTRGAEVVTERMRIDSSGNVTLQNNISVGAAAPTTSGTGITFPATQAASTNANTLDDYEEGTWTPNQGAGLTVVGTFGSSGTYTKIGRLVTVIGAITPTTSVASSNGGVISTNLPFTSGSVAVGSVADANGNGGSVISQTAGTSILSYPLHSASGALWFTITYFI
jgi:hypothetical protein